MESYAEIAKRYDEARARGEELQNLVPVKHRTPRHADSIYSLRFTSDEMLLLASAAKESGMKLSQFIRSAALDRAVEGARPAADIPPRGELSRIEQKLDELLARAP